MSALRFPLAVLWLATASGADYQAPAFTPAGLVNAASGETMVAPYSICSLYGSNFFLDGSAGAASPAVIPTTLVGVTVLIGPVPAGILYVSGTQINLLIPNSLTPGSYPVRVVRSSVASQPVSIVIQEVAPGLFASSPGIAAAQHADGSPVTRNSPAAPGEVMVLYGTGFGRAQPDPSGLSTPVFAAPIVHHADVQVMLDGVAVDPSRIEYAGVAPLNPGLYQINVRLPDELPAADPEVRVSIAGIESPPGLRLLTTSGALQ